MESIAKSSPLSETEVARRILELTRAQESKVHILKYAHIGYYLIGKGRAQAEWVAGMRNNLKQKILQLIQGSRLACYLWVIILLTTAITAFLFYTTRQYGHHSWYLLLALVCLSVSGTAHFAIALTNWVATLVIKPALLPRMDYSEGYLRHAAP